MLWFDACQDKLQKMMKQLQTFGMPLTDREMAILAVSVVEMEQNGCMPFNMRYFVQVVVRRV